ncbi:MULTISPECIES: hypothetical protein [Pseudomonas syringae group]|uniref:hypothetical protein n=1 Tax=Pseudomonas syringae group TaxID=136849 RepID=UPI000EFE0F58|nr:MULTISPECIES: hypothetical protein [Pseudomonas syringae group]MCF5804842.1 hypothetical protein [Pseudomonas tremae]MCF5811604.1 hypothetical protein [Pseudomonas tremae]RMN33451.1 hypothetical protein ALQ61_200043 [Pseudomonas coronafaciens pv. zizaniae]
MNNVTKKSALEVLALTTFAIIGLQGTAFATEAKHAVSVTDVNYSVVKDAEKNQIGSTKVLPLQARITLGSGRKINGACQYWPQDCG